MRYRVICATRAAGPVGYSLVDITVAEIDSETPDPLRACITRATDIHAKVYGLHAPGVVVLSVSLVAVGIS